MTVRSAWHYNSPAQNPGQTRADSRLAPLETPTPIDAMTGRSGVIPGGTGLNLTGSVMTGTIALGRAIVQGTASQGAYPFVVTAAETFTVANGHASLPRIDSVFAVIYDQAYDASGVTSAQIVYVPGVAASSPSAPSSVTNSNAYLKLWDIAVPALASAGSPINWATALTDKRVFTVAVGGITPGGSNVAGAFAGQWRDGGGSAGILERYNGTSWEQAVRLGNSGLVSLGDVSLSRLAAGVAQVSGGLNLSGDLTLSSGRVYRNKVSAQTTVVNSATETVIATMTVPANDPANSTYRIKAWGTIANGATTPNNQWKLRVGGLSGVLAATISYTFGGASAGTRTWSMQADVVLLTTGASGTWFGQLTGVSNMNTSTSTFNSSAPVIQDGVATVTKDTTIAEDLVITSTWTTAASANTMTCYGYTAERIS